MRQAYDYWQDQPGSYRRAKIAAAPGARPSREGLTPGRQSSSAWQSNPRETDAVLGLGTCDRTLSTTRGRARDGLGLGDGAQRSSPSLRSSLGRAACGLRARVAARRCDHWGWPRTPSDGPRHWDTFVPGPGHAPPLREERGRAAVGLCKTPAGSPFSRGRPLRTLSSSHTCARRDRRGARDRCLVTHVGPLARISRASRPGSHLNAFQQGSRN